jgi:hypothetical protein
MLPYPIKVKALPGYKIWLEYNDGVKGEIDLSHLVGKGVFALWNDYQNFEKVYITDYRAIAWSEDLDICPDTQYMILTGKTVEEYAKNK